MRPGARTDVGPPPRFITSEPRLGFGAWAVGGRSWGATGDAAERESAIRRALERGITFFDTAPTYGDGESERLLGRVLRAPRERVAIATKVGPHDDPRASLEGSLRRLASDYVDLIQLHEALQRWEWSLEKLLKLREEGKALGIGLCNATHLQIARATELAPLVSYQGPYNLFDRDVEQRELPLSRERGLAFLAYRPLASGLLAGTYPQPPEFPEDDHRRKIYWFKGPEFERRPGVTVVLAGARSPEQVAQNLAAPRHLAPATVAAIDEIVADVFRPAVATEQARRQAATWGERERFIVHKLDGRTAYEAIAAEWTDRGGTPMIAAQIKVFVDQLAEGGLVHG